MELDRVKKFQRRSRKEERNLKLNGAINQFRFAVRRMRIPYKTCEVLK